MRIQDAVAPITGAHRGVWPRLWPRGRTGDPRGAAMRPARSPWQVFRIASIAVFLVSIDATVLYAAFPALRGAFAGATAADLSWVLNAYTVVYAALLVPAGRVADLRGRRRMFLVGLGVFLVASLCCGLAGSVETLIAMRAVQAVGAALLLPASLSIVLAAFPVERRAVVVSLWGAVAALASAVGPSLGSFLVDRWGWPWAFFLNLPPGLWAIWRGARLLDAAERERRAQAAQVGDPARRHQQRGVHHGVGVEHPR